MTTQRSCTGLVPVTITGGNAAGQEPAEPYRPLLLMKWVPVNGDQGRRGQIAADLRVDLYRAIPSYLRRVARVVPDLYRAPAAQRLVDAALLAVLYPPLYLAAWWMDRSDKRQASGRWAR